MVAAPPAEVLDAFGATDEPVPLPGGQGGAWRTGDMVLKPTGFAPETRWRATVLDTLSESRHFRVARPVRAHTGDWLHHGWEAWHAIPGQTDVRRPDDALRVAGPFHDAVAHLPRPAWLDHRDDPWTRADRMAWRASPLPTDPLLRRLADLRRPVREPHQVVHGDLLGNVLFDDGASRRRTGMRSDNSPPPGIIDWPMYWRPAGWAAAVIVVDALCWYDAGADLIARWDRWPQWHQLLLRALMFRIGTDHAMADPSDGAWRPHPAYGPVIDVVLAMPQ